MSAFLPFGDTPISRFVDFRGLPSLLTAGLVCAGLMGGVPNPSFGQRTQTPTCSEPSPCPATDTTKNPEVTSFEPQSSSIDKDVTLHVYGQHRAPTDAPPRRLSYRDSEMSGRMGRTNDEVDVKSPCHVVTTLYVEGSRRLSAGDSVEFRLQRAPPTKEAARQEGATGTVSDWHYVKLTPSQTLTLEIDPTAKAEQDPPCEGGDPAATAIGELSGRHHMNTVRLESIVAETNAETGSDEEEYGLKGETGTIRVNTSKSLPSVDAWYSVTGEVSMVGGEHLKEQDRSACG